MAYWNSKLPLGKKTTGTRGSVPSVTIMPSTSSRMFSVAGTPEEFPLTATWIPASSASRSAVSVIVRPSRGALISIVSGEAQTK